MSDGDNRYFLAQANIGRIIAPLDDPSMAGFVTQLDFINSVADQSSGFVQSGQTAPTALVRTAGVQLAALSAGNVAPRGPWGRAVVSLPR